MISYLGIITVFDFIGLRGQGDRFSESHSQVATIRSTLLHEPIPFVRKYVIHNIIILFSPCIYSSYYSCP